MAISPANSKENGTMLLVGMNSWIQSSTGTVLPDAPLPQRQATGIEECCAPGS